MSCGLSLSNLVFPFAESQPALVCGKLGEEGCCGHDQGHMAMPAMPGSGLAMIEAEIVLGAQEALLDGPSKAGGAGDVLKRRALGRMNEVIPIPLNFD